MPTGTAAHYVSGSGNDPVDLPRAEAYRKAHEPRAPKPTGLDWGAIAPTCKGCGQKSGTVSFTTGLCDTCAPVSKAKPATEQGSPQTADSTRRPRSTTPTRTSRVSARPAAAQEASLSSVAAAGAHPGPVELAPDHGPHAAAVSEPTAKATDVVELVPATDRDQDPGRRLVLELADVRAVLLRAHGHPDPAVGAVRRAAIETIEALRVVLDNAEAVPPPVAPRPPARRTSSVEVDEDQVLQAYAAGDTQPEIAARHGVLPKRIRKILDEHGVERRDDRAGHSGGRSKPLEDYDADQVRVAVEGYAAGDTLDQLAATFGCSAKQVTNILTKAGVELRPPAHIARGTVLDDQANAEIARRYAEGESSVVLAAEFRIRAERCRNIVRAQGGTMRARGPSSNGMGAASQRLVEVGATARQIKQWALDQGLIERIPKARVARHLVEAYAAAHPQAPASELDEAAVSGPSLAGLKTERPGADAEVTDDTESQEAS